MPTPKSKRNYRKEYDRDQASPQQRKNNDKRKKARREAEKSGRVKKFDGKEVDHIKPLSKGGSNNKSNQRVVTRHTNRVKSKK